MNKICLIMPGSISKRMESMVRMAVENTETILIENPYHIPDLRGKKIIFAMELNDAGIDIPMLQVISALYKRGEDSLMGSTGALLVDSPCELYTKSSSQTVIFLANRLGCRFPGHPVVEATASLENFRTWQKQMDMPLKDICMEFSRRLGRRILEYEPQTIDSPNILALHSSYRKTSNTLELWHMISENLSNCNLNELHVENGDVLDCKGCSYKTCIHYSQQSSCFYGGVMVENIFPAIEKAHGLVWICPNYNDALSANLTAVINRLTALYRRTSFYKKTMFSIIVSGNSGSDSVAKQLIGALNINKGFALPPYFSIMATANDTGEIRKIANIEQLSENFSIYIKNEIKA